MAYRRKIHKRTIFLRCSHNTTWFYGHATENRWTSAG